MCGQRSAAISGLCMVLILISDKGPFVTKPLHSNNLKYGRRLPMSGLQLVVPWNGPLISEAAGTASAGS